jgi:hypothetical protein
MFDKLHLFWLSFPGTFRIQGKLRQQLHSFRQISSSLSFLRQQWSSKDSLISYQILRKFNSALRDLMFQVGFVKALFHGAEPIGFCFVSNLWLIFTRGAASTDSIQLFPEQLVTIVLKESGMMT